MPQESSPGNFGEMTHNDCPFCQYTPLAQYVLQETAQFLLVADHAPLVPGHLLIIPRHHYACYGAVPASFDEELSSLKQTVRDFFTRFYAAPIFWEHGVFHQTVFHAHLHGFPFGEIEYPSTENRHTTVVASQDDLRNWYALYGHYFYLQDQRQAYLFPPDKDDYAYIVQAVLKPGVIARNSQYTWRSPQQRQVEGKPSIQALITNWQRFSQTTSNQRSN